jgi:hypothetical protein
MTPELAKILQSTTPLYKKVKIAEEAFKSKIKEHAIKYFQDLALRLNSPEYQVLIAADETFRNLDEGLSHHNQYYSINNGGDPHLHIKDFVYVNSQIKTGTLLEIYPTIKQQLDEIFALDPKTKLAIEKYEKHNQSIRGIFEVTVEDMAKIILTKMNPHTIYPLKTILSFECNAYFHRINYPENYDGSLRIFNGSEIIFPNTAVLKESEQLRTWYAQCHKAGLTPYEIIVKPNARQLTPSEDY